MNVHAAAWDRKMKITKTNLSKIIKEEYERMQQEVRYGGAYDSRGEYTGDPAFDEDDENLEFVVKRLAKRYDDFQKSGAAEKFPNLAKRIEMFLRRPEPEGGLPASSIGSEFLETIAGILRE